MLKKSLIIPINYNDIFKYVVGDSACPVERALGPNYEVMEDFVYDGETKKMIPQNENFAFFMQNMETLRKNIRSGFIKNRDEIIYLCKKISELGEVSIIC